MNKKHYLILGLIIILISGFLIFQKEPPTITYANIAQASLIDYPEQYNFRQTINDCGPFNVAAVVRTLSQQEVSSATFAEEIGWRLPNKYTLPWGMEAQLKDHGIEIEIPNIKKLSDEEKLDYLKEQLSLKHPITLLGQQENYEHYITLLGFDSKKDEFYAYDPLGKKGEEGFVLDENEALPGNRTLKSSELLEFWRGGGMYGVYEWYGIVSKKG